MVMSLAMRCEGAFIKGTPEREYESPFGGPSANASWLEERMANGRMFVSRASDYRPPPSAKESTSFLSLLTAPFVGESVSGHAASFKGDNGAPRESGSLKWLLDGDREDYDEAKGRMSAVLRLEALAGDEASHVFFSSASLFRAAPPRGLPRTVARL